MSSLSTEEILQNRSEYKYGFITDIERDSLEPGLSEETIRQIALKRDEPDFLLEFRLKSYRHWLTLKEPEWANISYPRTDYNSLVYFSAPKQKALLGNLEDADPELLKTFQRLGIPLDEQKQLANVAVDLVFDSVSIGTTFKKKLTDAGVIFCSFSEAVRLYPDLIRQYLGTVVPAGDNFFAALNSAVFTDGSFVYVPAGVACPMEISTYFRINDKEAGQFERTLIIAEEGSSVSYLEGCTAPAFSTKQMHAAVVELIALKDAKIKYSTVQNWYTGDLKTGEGGVHNFVTKRGLCKGEGSKISWTQVEVGSAVTWKYPSCILAGDNSVGEFYSVALTNGKMQADTGTKMIHLGKNTRSVVVSKGISADESHNTFRSLVTIKPGAKGARNHTQCDSMLVGNCCSANTFPSIEVMNTESETEHEATTSKIHEEQLFYLQSRGLTRDQALNLVVNGFCQEVIQELPMEFAEEAKKLLLLKLENSVG
ncbi:UPF0051 protein [Candidatus Clavichlamydia salmonicola]|uniref:Fe-S cluster assembly protein SufB n=1 Tax=Candidatus Clavichlamydia salmonicola TaxID=469812 RepID=UPI0018919F75|nr:Fe-S cluster assembly protein SufB [Candidatus Clavichlamydia salmonicola]MBF5050717.1 UPF0051 protein [Candidatus Clavichlamydia salmonicola]